MRRPVRTRTSASVRRDGHDETQQDGELVASDPPAATALPSTAAAQLVAKPPEIRSEYMC